MYWGKEPWDGPRSLHDFLDFGSEDIRFQKELKKLVPEYPLHILDLNAAVDYSKFQTELRTVFELYRYRNDKKEFREYVESHEECRHLDEESCWIIGRFTNAENLLVKADKDKKEEKNMDVGSAIWDIREEGVQEGIAQGISQGIKALVETCKEFNCSKKKSQINWCRNLRYPKVKRKIRGGLWELIAFSINIWMELAEILSR